MADFGSGMNLQLQGTNLQALETQQSLASVSEALKDVDLGRKQADYDPMGSISAVVEEAKARQAQQAGALRVDTYARVDGLVELGALAGKAERLVREATVLLRARKLKEARAKLTEALREEPDHHEAIVLMGASFFEERSPRYDMEALRWFARLRGQSLEEDLLGRMTGLRGEIRDRLILHVMLQTMLMGRLIGWDAVLPQLRELVDLDPETGQYHLLLANSLVAADKIEAALAAVERGLAEGDAAAHPALLKVKEEAERRHVRGLIGPVVELFKKREFVLARHKLALATRDFRHVSIVQALDTWLGELAGGGFLVALGLKKNREIRPPRDEANAEKLYFLVCGAEIGAAREAMRAGNHEGARGPLQDALELAPDFAYLHYLLAGVYYHMAGSRFKRGKVDLDDQFALLEDAERHARLGAHDKEITDAPKLLETIRGALKVIRGVADAVKRHQQEAAKLNPAMREYGAIMESVKKGVSSIEHFDTTYQRMTKLSRELPAIKRALGSDQGREAFGQLEGAVQRAVVQLEGMKPSIDEQRAVRDAFETFKGIMDDVKGALKSPSKLKDIQRRFEALKSQIRTARAGLVRKPAPPRRGGKLTLSDPRSEAERALDELEKTVQARLDELAGAGDAATVNQHIEMFNTMMSALNSGNFKIKSRDDLEMLRGGFQKMRDDVDRDRRKLSSAQGRQALGDLSEAIGNVLNQLPG
ncbi:MAG: hypothetical protein ABIO70_01650 [Pseudomonadota bacterium]